MFGVHEAHFNTQKYYAQGVNVLDTFNASTYHHGMHIGKVIEALAERAGLSDNALADRAGMKQPTVTRILNGESADPRRSNIERLASVFGYSADQMYAMAASGNLFFDDNGRDFTPDGMDYVVQDNQDITRKHNLEDLDDFNLHGIASIPSLIGSIAMERLTNRLSHSAGGLDREAWEIEKKAVTAMVSEIAKRKVPPHIYQSMMDLLLSCPLKSEKTKPTEPMFTEEQEKVVNKLLEEIDRMQKK